MRRSRLPSGSRRRVRPETRRTEQLSSHGFWKAFAEALHPELIQVKRPERPFFTTLHDLLDQGSELTLGGLADAAGEQTYGLLVLLMAFPSLVPGLNLGTAPVGGLGILGLGIQMIQGTARPWIPERIRRQPIHPGRMKAALARLEAYLARFGGRREERRTLSQRWMGLLVAWTGFLLFLPVPLPFGNQFPAFTLLALGAALLEERPLWGWIGALMGLANTLYFAVSFHLILRECTRLLQTLSHGFS